MQVCRWSFALLAWAMLLALASAGSAKAECRVRWIVNAGSLTRSEPKLGRELIERVFDNPCTYLVVSKATQARYADWRAIATRTITSVSQLAQCCGDGPVRALLYDPEAWSFTSPEEKADPARYACQAADWAHAHGMTAIATPATNLVNFSPAAEPGPGDRFDRFLRTRIAADVARCVDVYEIQAQGAEMAPGKFVGFVRAVAAQARAANPKVLILAGLSTNPSGQSVSPDALDAAARSIDRVVDGYWLNIPAGGAYCPRCGEPRPEVALKLLQRLAAQP